MTPEDRVTARRLIEDALDRASRGRCSAQRAAGIIDDLLRDIDHEGLCIARKTESATLDQVRAEVLGPDWQDHMQNRNAEFTMLRRLREAGL